MEKKKVAELSCVLSDIVDLHSSASYLSAKSAKKSLPTGIPATDYTLSRPVT